VSFITTHGVVLATLGDVLNLYAAYCAIPHPDEKTAKKQADTLSGVRSLVRYIPEVVSLPPARRQLYDPCKRLIDYHRNYDISLSRAQSIQSAVRSMLKWAERVLGRPDHEAAELTPEWRTLMAIIADARWDRAALSRFARWASATGVSPDAVTDEALAAFRIHLGGFLTDHLAKRREVDAVKAWNKLRETQPAWPQQHLEQPVSRRPGVLEEEYDPAFLADLKEYGRRSLSPAGSAGSGKAFSLSRPANARVKPLSEASVITYTNALKLCASRLGKARGFPVGEVTSLAELVTPASAEDILNQVYEDLGWTSQVRVMNAALRDVAKNYCTVPDDVMVALDKLAKQLPPQVLGMTDKNRDRIRCVKPDQLATLYGLPEKLMKEVGARIKKMPKEEKLGDRDLQEARAAAGLAILLYTPPRMENLSSIRLTGPDRNLTFPDNSKAPGRLSFRKTKNHQPHSVPIRPQSMRILRWYRDVIIPRSHKDASILFPSEKAGRVTLGRAIEGTVARRTHLRFPPHFYRHLVAHIILVRSPGSYSAVQHLLGHKHESTTRAYYLGEEAEAALRHVAECMEAVTSSFQKGDFNPDNWSAPFE